MRLSVACSYYPQSSRIFRAWRLYRMWSKSIKGAFSALERSALTILIVAALCQMAKAQQEPFDLSKLLSNGPINPACATQQIGSNPILMALDTLSQALPGVLIQDVDYVHTDSCIPSKIMIKNSAPTFLDNAIKAGITDQKINGEVGTPSCQPNDFACCLASGPGKWPNFFCLKSLDYKTLNPIWRANFVLNGLETVGRELAASSILIPKEALQTTLLPGDALLYLQETCIHAVPSGDHQYKCDKAGWLFTRIDERSLDVAMAALQALGPGLRFIAGLPAPGPDTYRCDAAGIAPTVLPLSLPGALQLQVSSGDPANLRRPTNTAENFWSTVNINGLPAISFIQLKPVPTPPISHDGQSPFMKFSSSLASEKYNPFACYGSSLTDLFADPYKRPLFNNRLGSMFLTFLPYLDGVYREFSRLNQIEDLASVEDIRNAFQPSPGVCENICQGGGDFRCLLVPYKNGDQDGELKALLNETMKPLPFAISPEKMGEIFHMPGDPSIKWRGPTEFATTNILKNEGHAVDINVPGPTSLKVTVKLYSLFEAQFDRDEAARKLTLIFSNYGGAPVIAINKPTWKRFQGVVRRVDVDQERGIITTDNGTPEPGCIEVPLKPISPEIMVERALQVAVMLGKESVDNGLNEFFALKTFRKEAPQPGDPSQDNSCSCLSCNQITCCTMHSSGCICNVQTWEAEEGQSCGSPVECTCGGKILNYTPNPASSFDALDVLNRLPTAALRH
jgi:hypothetical protein